MNNICLLGRMTADPELRHTPSQVAVTSFTVAVDRSYTPKGQERQTDFIPVVAWEQTAEFVCRYFRKGQRIALQGSLRTRSYTDKDGNKRKAYEVVADNVFFAESKNGGAAPASHYDNQVPQYSEPQPAFSTASSGDFEEIVSDDELPF